MACTNNAGNSQSRLMKNCQPPKKLISSKESRKRVTFQRGKRRRRSRRHRQTTLQDFGATGTQDQEHMLDDRRMRDGENAPEIPRFEKKAQSSGFQHSKKARPSVMARWKNYPILQAVKIWNNSQPNQMAWRQVLRVKRRWTLCVRWTYVQWQKPTANIDQTSSTETKRSESWWIVLETRSVANRDSQNAFQDFFLNRKLLSAIQTHHEATKAKPGCSSRSKSEAAATQPFECVNCKT